MNPCLILFIISFPQNDCTTIFPLHNKTTKIPLSDQVVFDLLKISPPKKIPLLATAATLDNYHEKPSSFSGFNLKLLVVENNLHPLSRLRCLVPGTRRSLQRAAAPSNAVRLCGRAHLVVHTSEKCCHDLPS